MSAQDFVFAPVRAQAAAMRAGTLTSEALTRVYLERGERLGPKLGAYATLLPETALAAARTADAERRAGKVRGPLHGIPYAAKDLLAVPGAPTGWGARAFASQRLPGEATAVRRLREAGAVLLGKAAMIELAGGMGYTTAAASAGGPTRNPWSPEHWTCGSSSGSGAITAAGLASFSVGSETWGSIVCPAAFCGVTGLRPTYGRVSRHGAMALSPSMDKLGVLARSADDCALVLAALAAHDPADPASLRDAAFTDTPAPGPVRLGIVKNAWKNPSSGVSRAFDAALAALQKAGATTHDVTLPEGPWDEAGALIVGVECASSFAAFLDAGRGRELSDPLGKVAGYVNRAIPASDYVRAQQVRAHLQQRVGALFAQCDVLVAPSLPLVATRLDANLETAMDFGDPLGAIGNLCGLPALSVPAGFDDKLPVGLQLVGDVLDEAAVLRAARLYQANTRWHERRPPL